MVTTEPASAIARYWLPPEDEAHAVALARRVGEQLDDQHWMVVGGSRSLAGQLGRLMEQRIFDAEWGGHPPELMVEEYHAYEPQSSHATIVDAEGIVATARNIWSPTPELPTKLETDLGFDAGQLRDHHRLRDRYGSLAMSELATVAVRPDARGSIASGWVLGEMRYQQMCHRRESPSCAMIAVPFYRMIKSWGHEIEAFGGATASDYLGVVSQPAFFQPGPQSQIRDRRLFATLSQGWLSRTERSLTQPLVDLTESSSTLSTELAGRSVA